MSEAQSRERERRGETLCWVNMGPGVPSYSDSEAGERLAGEK